MTDSIFSPQLPSGKTDIIYWGNLHGSSLALSIANGAVKHGGATLLVTADTPSAMKLEKELNFFVSETNIEIKLLPDWETLPYDSFSPHQDIVSQRIETLYELTQNKKGIYIVPISTLLLRMPPVDYMGRYVLILEQGQKLELDGFRQGLAKAGYQHVSQVMGHGEYSIRGSIIDLFPMGSQTPFRIDLFDDEIDTIRLFDPDSQRSDQEVKQIRLLPAREFPTDAEAIARFKQHYLELFEAGNTKESLYYQVSKGLMPGGIEYYLPLFFDQTTHLFDYLHADTLLMLHGDLASACEFYWADLTERYEQLRYNPARPLLPPAMVFHRFEEIFGHFKQWPRVQVQHDAIEPKAGRYNFATEAIGDIAIKHNNKVPWTSIVQACKTWQSQGVKVLFSAESQGRRESLLSLLGKAQIKVKAFETIKQFLASHEPLGICIGLAENSFVLQDPDGQLAFITETQLLGHKISQRRLRDKRQATDESAVIRNLAELTQGQPVVHIDHGVGRFVGLQTLDVGGVTTEYVTIEYAKEAKLYVPVASLHLISRYSGGDLDNAPLHSLGSDAWSKAKKKAAEKVRDVAAQLLDVYARRAAKPGFAYPIDWPEYQRFADSFPFEETADQQQAINAVIQDMGSPNAMDRLVCGDVGFGKTEVAMRAAFLAAQQGQTSGYFGTYDPFSPTAF